MLEEYVIPNVDRDFVLEEDVTAAAPPSVVQEEPRPVAERDSLGAVVKKPTGEWNAYGIFEAYVSKRETRVGTCAPRKKGNPSVARIGTCRNAEVLRCLQ